MFGWRVWTAVEVTGVKTSCKGRVVPGGKGRRVKVFEGDVNVRAAQKLNAEPLK